MRILPAWHEYLGKRQVKSPTIFVGDPGLLHALPGERPLILRVVPRIAGLNQISPLFSALVTASVLEWTCSFS